MYEKLMKIWIGLSSSDDVLGGEYKIVHTDFIHDLKEIIDNMEEKKNKIEKLPYYDYGDDIVGKVFSREELVEHRLYKIEHKLNEYHNKINEIIIHTNEEEIEK